MAALLVAPFMGAWIETEFKQAFQTDAAGGRSLHGSVD